MFSNLPIIILEQTENFCATKTELEWQISHQAVNATTRIYPERCNFLLSNKSLPLARQEGSPSKEGTSPNGLRLINAPPPGFTLNGAAWLSLLFFFVSFFPTCSPFFFTFPFFFLSFLVPEQEPRDFFFLASFPVFHPAKRNPFSKEKKKRLPKKKTLKVFSF